MRGKDVNLEWVVVANRSRARIFRMAPPARVASEIADVVNLDSRVHERDLVSDAPGRGAGSGSAHHGLGDGSTHKEESLKRFVREVVEQVERGRRDGRFARLHLVAEPGTLGLIRKGLSSRTASLVDVTVSKDLVDADTDQIARQISLH